MTVVRRRIYGVAHGGVESDLLTEDDYSLAMRTREHSGVLAMVKQVVFFGGGVVPVLWVFARYTWRRSGITYQVLLAQEYMECSGVCLVTCQVFFMER